MHETSDFFYSIITFSYTKCFVQLYTLDEVFTLSYGNAFRKTDCLLVELPVVDGLLDLP